MVSLFDISGSLGYYYHIGPAGLFNLLFYGHWPPTHMSISSYIKETRAEFKFVKWPTRKQAIGYSIAVICISVVMAYALGALDFGFQQALARILGF